MPHAILTPPSKAGPAGHEAARMRCRLPRVNSVLVQISHHAISALRGARSRQSMLCRIAPTCPLVMGRRTRGPGMNGQKAAQPVSVSWVEVRFLQPCNFGDDRTVSDRWNTHLPETDRARWSCPPPQFVDAVWIDRACFDGMRKVTGERAFSQPAEDIGYGRRCAT